MSIGLVNMVSGNFMSKLSSTIMIFLCLFALFLASCAGQPAPAEPPPTAVPPTATPIPIATTPPTVIPPTSIPCGVDAAKIIGRWKTDNGATEFTFTENCAVTARIDRTEDEAGEYNIPEQGNLSLKLPGREGQLQIQFAGDNILIIEDVAAGEKLILQKSDQ